MMFTGHLTFLVGIHSEIAKARHEFWSSLAPLPVEVVLAAGQKAKEEKSKTPFGFLFCAFISGICLLIITINRFYSSMAVEKTTI